MDEFERQVAVALRDAVPEPEREILPDSVVRLGRRRRLAAVTGSAGAVLVAVLALVLALTVPGRSSSHAPAATRPTATPHAARLQFGGLTFDYPRSWSARIVGPQDARQAFVSSKPFAAHCKNLVGGSCIPTVDFLGPAGVFIAMITTGTSLPVPRERIHIHNAPNRDFACPPGTVSTKVASFRSDPFILVTGCLDSTNAAEQAFLRFVQSAR